MQATFRFLKKGCEMLVGEVFERKKSNLDSQFGLVGDARSMGQPSSFQGKSCNSI